MEYIGEADTDPSIDPWAVVMRTTRTYSAVRDALGINGMRDIPIINNVKVVKYVSSEELKELYEG